MKHTPSFSKAAAFGLSFLCFALVCSAQKFDLAWSHLAYGANLGTHGLRSFDTDGDGQEEVVFSGGGHYANRIYMAKYDGKSLENKWFSDYYGANPFSAFFSVDINDDKRQELVLVHSQGDIEVLDGITRALLSTFKAGIPDVRTGQVVNIDEDPESELLLASYSKLVVCDLDAGAVEWESNLYATPVLLGDVDGDGKIEIICNGTNGNGYVLDATTKAVKWEYLGGFGVQMALADVKGDSIPELIGYKEGYVTVFDGQLKSPLWQTPYVGYGKMLVANIDNNPTPELIVGGGQGNKIYCYDLVTTQQKWEIQSPAFSGIANLAMGDPDGDGTKELMYTINDWNANALYFVNTLTLKTEYVVQNSESNFTMDLTDAGNKNNWELLMTSDAYSSFDDGTLQAFHAETKAPKWSIQQLPGEGPLRVMSTRARNDDQSEIVLANSLLAILDGKTRNVLFEAPVYGINQIREGDIDQDGIREIIVSSTEGRVMVYGYNGTAFVQEWQSIDLGEEIKDIEVFNCDDDPALEIVIAQKNIIHVYDGKTKLLQWQKGNTSEIRAIACGDIHADGYPEILVAAGSPDIWVVAGNLLVIDCKTKTIVEQQVLPNPLVIDIEITNVDTSARPEILVLSNSHLWIWDSKTFDILWKSGQINNGDYYNRKGGIVVKDIAEDQYLDIVVATSIGVYHFRSTSLLTDALAPKVSGHFPVRNAPYVAIDNAIQIIFSEPMDSASILAGNVTVLRKNGDTLSTTLSMDATKRTLKVQTVNGLPSSEVLEVVLKTGIKDLAGNGLDGNGNGAAQGSPADDYRWTFTTGSGIDSIGPQLSSAQLEPDTTWPGLPLYLDVLASDLSTVATGEVAGAEYFVDQKGLPGQGIPMSASDQFWNDAMEWTKTVVSTIGLSGGKHTLYVHAKDAKGNWGAWQELDFYLYLDAPDNWPMYNRNTAHTNNWQTCPIAPPLQVKWTKSYPGLVVRPVSYANGAVLVPVQGTWSGLNSVLYSLDTLDGSIKWEYDYGKIRSLNPVAYAYGRVYAQSCNNSGNSFVTAFDLGTGKINWQSPYEAQWDQHDGPTISAGNLYINGGQYGGIYSFDALSGQKRWFTALKQEDRWTPAVHNDIAYAYAEGQLTAHNTLTGSIVWQLELPYNTFPSVVSTTPVLDLNNRLVFVLSGGYFHAVNFDTKAVAWFLQGSFTAPPAVSNDTLYVVRSGKLEARKAKTGALLWTFAGDASLLFSPVVGGKYVYVSSEKRLFVVKASTGQKVWEFAGGGAVTLSDNMVLLAGTDGFLRAFTPQTSSAEQVSIDSIFNLTCQPNPFAQSTQITYRLEQRENVLLQILDLNGRVVATPVNTTRAAGTYTVEWDAEGMPAGMYICLLRIGDKTACRKVMRL